MNGSTMPRLAMKSRMGRWICRLARNRLMDGSTKKLMNGSVVGSEDRYVGLWAG